MTKRTSYPSTIADLNPDDRNPRTISDEAADGLRISLKEFGDISSIVFSLVTNKLVAGHQRVAQLKREYGHNLRIVPPKDKTGRGWIECPNGDLFAVRFVDWPEDRARLANVSANNPHIAGEFDESLAGLLDDLQGDFSDAFADLRLDVLHESFGRFDAMEVDAPELPSGDRSPFQQMTFDRRYFGRRSDVAVHLLPRPDSTRPIDGFHHSVFRD